MKLEEQTADEDLLKMVKRIDKSIDSGGIMVPCRGERDRDFLLRRFPSDDWVEGGGQELDPLWEVMRVTRAGMCGNLTGNDI
jgi:hypothetical protein